MVNYQFDVTVLVATYNPDLSKTKKTLESILLQKNVSIQIVIVDDGSRSFHREDIEDYFRKKNFWNYNIIANSLNQGTVKNIMSGIASCKGEYIKLISPGDCLCDDEVLYLWVAHMRKTGSLWSFGNAIYYKNKNEIFEIVEEYAHPQNIVSYNKWRAKKKARNYLLFKDIALGAATLCKNEVLKKYIKEIDGAVCFAEDNIYRIMMYDGVACSYYSENVILYEFGTGISTSGNDEWGKKIVKDWQSTNQILAGRDDKQNLKRDFECIETVYNNKIIKLYNCMFVKGYIVSKLRIKLKKRYTNSNVDNVFLKKIGFDV